MESLIILGAAAVLGAVFGASVTPVVAVYERQTEWLEVWNGPYRFLYCRCNERLMLVRVEFRSNGPSLPGPLSQ